MSDTPDSDPTPDAPRGKRRGAGGRPVAYDWDALWRAYVFADTPVSYAELAAKTGAPSERQIERVASKEKWPRQREEFRREVIGKFQAREAEKQTEIRTRHANLGKLLQALAVKGAAHLDPKKLEAIDVARLAKTGAELERKVSGLEEVNVRVGRLKKPEDLDDLSEAELWQVAGMLPPEDDDDQF